MIGGLFVILAVAHVLRRGGVGSTSSSAPPATSSSATGCFTAAQAWHEIGHTACVQFTVGSTDVSTAGNAYLDQFSNYKSSFSVWIPSAYAFGSTAVTRYANQIIRVTGVISSYEGAPQIEVTDPSQITSAG